MNILGSSDYSFQNKYFRNAFFGILNFFLHMIYTVSVKKKKKTTTRSMCSFISMYNDRAINGSSRVHISNRKTTRAIVSRENFVVSSGPTKFRHFEQWSGEFRRKLLSTQPKSPALGFMKYLINGRRLLYLDVRVSGSKLRCARIECVQRATTINHPRARWSANTSSVRRHATRPIIMYQQLFRRFNFRAVIIFSFY